MTMTRKDYVLIAAALRTSLDISESQTPAQWLQFKQDCRCVAEALLKDNPRFDRERFLKACGLEV